MFEPAPPKARSVHTGGKKGPAPEFSRYLQIQVVLRLDILAMVLNSKTWGHSSLVTERRCSLSGDSLRVNGEERNATPAPGGGGGGRERERRRCRAAVPHRAYRGRAWADCWYEMCGSLALH